MVEGMTLRYSCSRCWFSQNLSHKHHEPSIYAVYSQTLSIGALPHTAADPRDVTHSKPFSMPRNAPPGQNSPHAQHPQPQRSPSPIAPTNNASKESTHCPSRARAQDASPQKHTRDAFQTLKLSLALYAALPSRLLLLSRAPLEAAQVTPNVPDTPLSPVHNRKTCPLSLQNPQTTTPFNRTCRGPSSKSGVSRINTIHSLREYPRLSYRLQPLSSRAAR